MTPNQILDRMIEGKVNLYKVTIPEGCTIKQVGDIFEKAGIIKKDAFIKTAENRDYALKKGIDAETLEGYLFPDTYHFSKNASADQIVSRMLDRFRETFSPEWEQRAKALGFSIHEVVTLASLVEKETGVAEERPIISSVFHNRLRKKMRLETDPSVIYGIKNFDGNITKKHLRTYSAYNTYLISGLPPGPISNPGAKALASALFPADTKYLFFVSKKDSTHHFSTNLRDHNRAVRKYQLRKRRQ
jgi:UPF0755 protein